MRTMKYCLGALLFLALIPAAYAKKGEESRSVSMKTGPQPKKEVATSTMGEQPLVNGTIMVQKVDTGTGAKPAAAAAEGEQAEDFTLFENVHGFLTFGTDHRWRGISFSKRSPEIVGALLYVHPIGLYVGLIGFNSWLTNGGLALVPIAGYKGNYNKLDYDINIRYEHFPSYQPKLPGEGVLKRNPRISELYGQVGYDFDYFRLAGGVGYSPDYYFMSGSGWYLNTRLDIPLPYQFKIDGGAGYQTTDRGGALPKSLWFKDHWNWDVGLSYVEKKTGVILTFRYIDTSLSREQCDGGLRICKKAFIGQITKKF